MADLQSFEKQPDEQYFIAIEWQGKLPTGTALVSGAVAATRYPDLVTDNTVLASTVAIVSGTQSLVRVKLGEHGRDYRVTFLMTLSNGDILEEDVLMQVRQI